MLFKKLLRTFGRYKAQFISMIVMIFLGIGIFAGFNAEWYSIEKDCGKFFSQSNLADYRIYLTDEMKASYHGFTEEDLDKILSVEGIKEASRVIEINTTESKENETVKMCVTTNKNVTTPVLVKGDPYDESSEDGLWLSKNYAERNSYNIGDSITLSYGSMLNKTFTIKGYALSGEYLINTDGIAMMPNYDTIGYCFISPEAYKSALGYEFYTQINVISSLDASSFSEKVDAALGNTYQVLAKEDLSSYSEAYGESDEGKTMGTFLPFIFLLIAVLTMVTTMNRLTTNEKTQIGILKALGFKDKKITLHYTSYSLFIGAVSSVLGLIIGYFVAYFIFSKDGSMGTYFEMPDWSIHMPPFVYLGILGFIAFLTLIGYLSVKKILKGTAADALRPYQPKKMKSLLIERGNLFHKLGFSSRWNLRDTFRHKARTFMTIFGVFGCTLLLFASFAMTSTMDDFVDSYYNSSLNYQSKISLSESVTNDKAREIASLYEGDYASTLAIKIEADTYTADIFSDTNGKYVLLDNDSKPLKETSKNGVYVCKRIAEDYHLKKGSTFSFSLYGKKDVYTVEVYDTTYALSEGIFMSEEYAVSKGIPYTINSVFTDTKKADIASSMYITSVNTKEDIMKTFDSFMSIMDEMIIMLVVFSCLLAFVVLYNLGSMSFVERYRELSTLKVLGFKDKKIRIIMISQTAWLTLIGIILGIPGGMVTIKLLMKLLAANYEMKVTYAPYVFLISVVLTFAVSCFVSLMVSRKTKKIDMVESLKAE